MIITVLFAFAGLLNAQQMTISSEREPEPEPSSIYKSIAVLVDSLRFWAETPPHSFSRSSMGMNTDSLNWSEYFPECHVIKIDSLGSKRIALPLYMKLLTMVLILDNSGSNPQWTSPVEWDDGHLLVDSIPVPVTAQSEPDSIFIDHIREKITMLRTMGLPEELRYKPSLNDSSQIIVTVRGRDMVDIVFKESAWLAALSKLTNEMQVYAGLLSVKVDSSEAFVKYYILITYPGIEGHHFLEWREKLIQDNNRWQTGEITVMFSPYIRTDNLKDLFAKPKATDRDPVELRINR